MPLIHTSSAIDDDRPLSNDNNIWYDHNSSDTVVVFVHGIFSDSRSAWSYEDPDNPNNNQYWPRLIRDDPKFRKPAIFLGGFYTEIGGGDYNMRDAANELYQHLKISIEPAHAPVLSRPNIMFITHSTGGIIVRHMLVKRFRDFVDKKVGLILIASPSTGSRDASRLKWLARLANQKLGQQLQWDHPFLEELDKDFKNLVYHQTIPSLIGAEAIENHFIVKWFRFFNKKVLVEASSAGRYFDEPIRLPNTNHFTTIKPNGRDHPAHIFLRNFYETKFVPAVVSDQADSTKPSPGLNTAPAFQSRVEAFLDEYLKSEIGPVPFGGRDGELACLDAWLKADNEAPRFLVTAPAGRGKSALLVRWIERLKGQGVVGEGGWRLLFVPISMRFGTNHPKVFYQALAERLAVITRQDLETPVADAARYYADKVRESLSYLAKSDCRVLVILDGLDEALRGEFDESVFPKVMPAITRILVSARWQAGDVDSVGWLRRLGWYYGVKKRTLELDPLDAEGIGDVLTKMGAPTDIVAADPVLVERLAELTAGEPLLLRYYAEDLWQRGAQIAQIMRDDLDSMRPGFGAYFDRWFESQQKAWREAGEHIDQRTVDTVLMVLAFAYGPLEEANLLRLIELFPGSTFISSPQQLLGPLKRFIVGDGSYNYGYVLSHPKIGEHLQLERFGAYEYKAHEAFVDWGRSVVESVNQVPVKAVNTPRYLLQFHCRHLQTIRAPLSDFMNLVEDGWRRSWEYYEGSQQGFSSDVGVALDFARAELPLGNLGDQCRCLLVLSSIRSLGQNIPRQLIIAAVKKNILSLRQAKYLASFMESPDDYPITLGIIAADFALDQNSKQELLQEALEAAKRISYDQYRARALGDLARYLNDEQIGQALEAAKKIDDDDDRTDILFTLARRLNQDQLGSALEAAEKIGDHDYRAQFLGELAQHLNEEQRQSIIGQALEAAEKIGNDIRRARAMGDLARYLNDEQIGRALEAAKEIGDDYNRARALGGLAEHFDEEQRQSIIDEALEAAKEIGDDYNRARALGGLAEHFDEEQRQSIIDEALEAAKQIGDDNKRAQVLVDLKQHLNEEQLGQALEAAEEIGDDYDRAQALGGLAQHLDEEQQQSVIGEALEAAKQIDNHWNRARTLGDLAEHFDEEQRQSIIDEALEAAKEIGDDYDRAQALVDLKQHLSEEQRQFVISEALKAAKKIGDRRQRATALGSLAQHLNEEQLGQALEAAKEIGDDYDRAQALVSFAQHLNKEQRRSNIGQALDVAKQIEDDYDRAQALVDLTQHLNEEQLGQALEATRKIGNNYCRAVTLSNAVRHLDEEQRQSIIGEAFQAAKEIGDDYQRAEALVAITQHLNEEQLGQALEAAEKIGNDYYRAQTLGSLAQSLNEDQRQSVIGRALEAAKKIGSDYSRAQALGSLAQYLDNEQLGQALKTANEISDCDVRTWALSSLAQHFNDEQLAQTLKAAKQIRTGYPRAQALSSLAQHLSEEQLGQALEAAKQIGDDENRTQALVSLAQYLNGEQLGQALEAAEKIGNDHYRAQALGSLAQYLNEDRLGQALEAAKKIGDDNSRARSLADLARYLDDDLCTTAFEELIKIGGNLPRPQLVRALASFSKLFVEVSDDKSYAQLRTALQDTAKWYP